MVSIYIDPQADLRFVVAVLAFKTAYSMEMTRRQNDKRILSLYVEMKDMMEVLFQYTRSFVLLKPELIIRLTGLRM